jgi:hypothetical protein
MYLSCVSSERWKRWKYAHEEFKDCVHCSGLHALPVCMPALIPACLHAALSACLPFLLACLPVAYLPACLHDCLFACLAACVPACVPCCVPAYIPKLPACLRAFLHAAIQMSGPCHNGSCLPCKLLYKLARFFLTEETVEDAYFLAWRPQSGYLTVQQESG